ncbi:MAG: T9SS type A sorting domain-containing protein [Chlorobi bacterium]|nr:T9SS type A sorting domain-containing protein [Chlorobiota bacterium]
MKNSKLIKTCLQFFAVVMITGQLFAQNTFYKTFDGSGNDVGFSVATTLDGGYVVVGKTNSYGAGDYDVWLLKTDANGDSLWTKTYGGSGFDEGRCVQQTSDGGFIVAANTNVPGHYVDGWVFKTDANGIIEWDYTFGGELNMDGASFVLEDDEGNFIVSGTVDGKSHIFKIDGSGNIIWEESYFSNNYSGTTSICPIADNRYAVVGSFQIVSAGAWYPNMFIIESTGELVTQLTWAQYEGGIPNFVIQSQDGGMLFGGAWTGAPALMRLGPTGMDVWEYIYPQTGLYSYMNSAVLNDDGSFVVVGNWESGAMLEINDSGDTLWTRKQQNDEAVFYTSAQRTSDNSLIMTGYGKPSATDHQIVLVKTYRDGSMLGIDVNNGLNRISAAMQISPNPFNISTSIRFKLQNTDFVELTVSDANGRTIRTLVKKEMPAGNQRVSWDGKTGNGSECPGGIYFVTLRLRSGLRQTTRVVKLSRVRF